VKDVVLGASGEEEIADDWLALLPVAIDAPVALLEPVGVPGQLEVDDTPAGALEVEALARGVGGQEDAGPGALERFLYLEALGTTHAALHHLVTPPERG